MATKHQHFFMEERDETIVSSHHKLPKRIPIQEVRDNTCVRVSAALQFCGTAKCNGCDFSECIANKL